LGLIPNKIPSILIVEDDFFQASVLEILLTSLNYTVIGKLKTGEEAVEFVSENNPDLIIMDISLDGKIDGISAAKIIQENRLIPLIYLTGNSDEVHINRAQETEHLAYLSKPISKGVLEHTLKGIGLFIK
jgi:CheY-like chemotaxis protein